ncbi:hypothetical protein GCM10009105_17570 [Dokdonella soli]|uniref:Uncharacterized protein n=2 Tax=Dokdonella soli TaxID=529810 RepID=A0ABN1IHK5_9GAMM
MLRVAALASALFILTPGVVAPVLAAEPPRKIYAQELVDQIVAAHPEIAVVAMHVKPPKASDNVIIASNIGRIGKKADADDQRVIDTGMPNLSVNKAGDRYEVELVMKDASHRPIGAIGIVFPYKAGDDRNALQKKAEKIRDDLARRISHVANLMENYLFDASVPTHTFAQHLVDTALDANGDIIIIAMHVATKSNASYPIIASNIGRIGKKADEDDMDVIKTGKPKLEINETGDRFESEGVLHDAGGKVIGAVGVVFPYKKGDDQEALHKKADEVRDAMARQIATVDALLQPAP